jgi:hypothetical protein
MLGELGSGQGLVLSVVCLALGVLMLATSAHRTWWEKTTFAHFRNSSWLGLMLRPKPRTGPSNRWRAYFLLLGTAAMLVGALGIYGSIAG